MPWCQVRPPRMSGEWQVGGRRSGGRGPAAGVGVHLVEHQGDDGFLTRLADSRRHVVNGDALHGPRSISHRTGSRAPRTVHVGILGLQQVRSPSRDPVSDPGVGVGGWGWLGP